MTSDNIQILRGGYEAFARRDIPGVLAAFSREIVWHAPDAMPYGGDYHGHDGVSGFFAQLAQYFTELSVEPREFIDAGDTVVVVARISATGAAGSVQLDSVHLWRLRDRKAVSFTEYIDTARLLQTIGEPATANA